MRIRCLHHLRVPPSRGEQDRAHVRRFYPGALGFEEIPKPRTFDQVDTTLFQMGGGEAHTYAVSPGEGVPRGALHFCPVVDDIDVMHGHFECNDCRCENSTLVPYRRRFYTYDPFDKQIEITAIE